VKNYQTCTVDGVRSSNTWYWLFGAGSECHPRKGQRQENHDFLPTDLLVQHLIFNAGILGWSATLAEKAGPSTVYVKHIQWETIDDLPNDPVAERKEQLCRNFTRANQTDPSSHPYSNHCVQGTFRP